MQLFPAIEDFSSAFGAGKNQLVWTRLVADLDTPVSLMLKLTEARKDSFLLESVTGGEVRGRYSCMGMKPDLIWECRGIRARLNRAARFDADGWQDEAADPLASLRALIAESRIELPPELPPMAAGLFGYLGYDMVRLVEHLPDINPDPLGLPDAIMLRPSVVLVVDGVKGEVTVVSPAWAGSGLNARAAYAQAAERVMDAVRDLDRTRRRRAATSATSRPASRCPTPATPATFRWSRRPRSTSAPATSSRSCPASAGRSLRPAALRALPRAPADQSLALHVLLELRRLPGGRPSPEILVRVEDGTVTIRPLAGTRPRGATPEEDLALEDELLADPKERAEHLMLVDLGRNDVGRVAKFGTVDPDEQSSSSATATSCTSSRT